MINWPSKSIDQIYQYQLIPVSQFIRHHYYLIDLFSQCSNQLHLDLWSTGYIGLYAIITCSIFTSNIDGPKHYWTTISLCMLPPTAGIQDSSKCSALKAWNMEGINIKAFTLMLLLQTTFSIWPDPNAMQFTQLVNWVELKQIGLQNGICVRYVGYNLISGRSLNFIEYLISNLETNVCFGRLY